MVILHISETLVSFLRILIISTVGSVSARGQASGWNICKSGRCGRLNMKNGWPVWARLFFLAFFFCLFLFCRVICRGPDLIVPGFLLVPVLLLQMLHLFVLRSQFLLVIPFILPTVLPQQIGSTLARRTRYSPLLLHSTTLLPSGLRTTHYATAYRGT